MTLDHRSSAELDSVTRTLPRQHRAAAALRDRLTLLRPTTCISAACATFLGAWIVGDGEITAPTRTAAAALCAGSVMAVANLANDVVDADLDRIEKADRPLAAGRVTTREATAWAVVLGSVVLAVGAIAAPVCLLLMGPALVLGVVYSTTLKGRRPIAGHLVVAAVSSYPVGAGALVGGTFSSRCAVATAAIFLFVLGYDVLKAVIDIGGDTQAGMTTIATRLGTNSSLRLVRLALLGAMAAGIGAAPWAAHPLPYIGALAGIGVVLTSASRAMRSGPLGCDRARRLLWFAWLPALAVLALLG